jgi:hypothetical protein
LVQDVAALRPLIRLAASSTSAELHLLVSKGFTQLDDNGRWASEIDQIGSEIGVESFVYESVFDVLSRFGHRSGMIIAGSESDARAHHEAHELFCAAPGRFRTVTLQHGLECVGFLHNARHDATSGRDVRFAADIAVAWFDPQRLRSVSTAELSKIYVAGPPILIDPPKRAAADGSNRPGLICENLHSVRFVDGRMREVFLDTFGEFAGRLKLLGEKLVLRPHPAGRFTERKGIPLPNNVEVSRDPLYSIELSDFSYVISAPSTILMDFAFAGVPAATWVGADGAVDASNFTGLAQVATVEDWWRFRWAAQWERAQLVAQQDHYIASMPMPTNVRDRYGQLVALS